MDNGGTALALTLLDGTALAAEHDPALLGEVTVIRASAITLIPITMLGPTEAGEMTATCGAADRRGLRPHRATPTRHRQLLRPAFRSGSIAPDLTDSFDRNAIDALLRAISANRGANHGEHHYQKH